LVLAWLLAASHPAAATDDRSKAAARALAKEAKQDFDGGRFDDAALKFQRAFEVARVPTLAVWAARALVKCGRLVGASELYRLATQLSPNDLWLGNAQQTAQEDARREMGELLPSIPKLRVRVEGATRDQVEVSVDQAKIANALLGFEIPADPGRRQIVGRRGAETVEETVELKQQERKEVVLRFSPVELATPEATVPPPGPLDEAAPPESARNDDAIRLTSTPAVEDVQASRPIYKRWWFWTGVGAVVVAGSVTAFMLNRSSGNGCSGSYPCAGVE
jgi:hypothetical protein